MKGLKVMNKYQWFCKVAFCFVFRFCELGQFHMPWLMSNDILLQILKLWYSVEIFPKLWGLKTEYFDICQNLIFDICQNLFVWLNPYYLRSYINIPLIFVSSFDIKKRKCFFGQLQQNTRHKTGTHFKTQL